MATAFGRHSWELKKQFAVLHERLKPLNKAPEFTFDEFLALTAPPEHWPILKQAAEVSTTDASGGYHTVTLKHPKLEAKHVSFNFVVNGDGNPPLMPRGTDVLRSAPEELTEKLVKWANREVEVAYTFKRSEALFDWLNGCMTKDQVRFVWPAIVSVASTSEQLVDLTNRIREFKPQRTLPGLPMEVRTALKETTSLLTAASMIDGQKREGKGPQVMVEYINAKFKTSRVEGVLGDVTP